MSPPDSDSSTLVTSPLDRLAAMDAPALRQSAQGTSPGPVRLTRRGRLRKWDRPKPPMDWRWWVGNVGKTLIATGLLLFMFVAYQLWGTGLETARAQNQLENEFEALLADAPPITAPPLAADDGTVDTPDPVVSDANPAVADPEVADPEVAVDDPEVAQPPADAPPDPVVAAPVETAPPVPVAQQNLPELENGQALARIQIPKIGVSDIVVAGISTADLKKGPGHFPSTPLPGQFGNSAIAGHRTTYGQPFFNVDKLDVGDDIVLTTLNGTYTYRVTGTEIVSANAGWVIATTDPTVATLTLTSCHPKYTARQRIVIFSELVVETSAPVGEPVINYGRPDPPPEDPAEPEERAEDGEVDSAQPDTADSPTVAPAVVDDTVTGTLAEEPLPAESDAAALGSAEVNEQIADAFNDGWFSDPGANLQVGLWGLLLSLVAAAAYALSRRLRRDWVGALVGIMPFIVALYFFFQNVNRLLPPAL